MSEKRFEKVVYGEEDECGRAWKIVDHLTKKEHKKPWEIEELVNQLWRQTQRFEKHNRRLEYENKQLKEELNELNIPIDEIKDTVSDARGRTVGVYYND